MNKSRVKLNICGNECVIASEDPESYVLSIGDEVQKAILGIVDANEHVSVTMAAILTALNYCDEAHKASSGADNLRSQIKDYLEDSSRARTEADEARKEIERLKREVQSLRARLSGGNVPDPVEPAAPKAAAAPVQRTHAAAAPAEKAEDSHAEEQQNFMSFFEKKTEE